MPLATAPCPDSSRSRPPTSGWWTGKAGCVSGAAAVGPARAAGPARAVRRGNPGGPMGHGRERRARRGAPGAAGERVRVMDPARVRARGPGRPRSPRPGPGEAAVRVRPRVGARVVAAGAAPAASITGGTRGAPRPAARPTTRPPRRRWTLRGMAAHGTARRRGRTGRSTRASTRTPASTDRSTSPGPDAPPETVGPTPRVAVQPTPRATWEPAPRATPLPPSPKPARDLVPAARPAPRPALGPAPGTARQGIADQRTRPPHLPDQVASRQPMTGHAIPAPSPGPSGSRCPWRDAAASGQRLSPVSTGCAVDPALGRPGRAPDPVVSCDRIDERDPHAGPGQFNGRTERGPRAPDATLSRRRTGCRRLAEPRSGRSPSPGHT